MTIEEKCVTIPLLIRFSFVFTSLDSSSMQPGSLCVLYFSASFFSPRPLFIYTFLPQPHSKLIKQEPLSLSSSCHQTPSPRCMCSLSLFFIFVLPLILMPLMFFVFYCSHILILAYGGYLLLPRPHSFICGLYPIPSNLHSDFASLAISHLCAINCFISVGLFLLMHTHIFKMFPIKNNNNK